MLSNGTIQIITNQNSTGFETARAIYSEPEFMIPIIILWALPFLLLLIIATMVEGKTSSGHRLGKPMLLSPNFAYIVVILLFQLILMLMILFPIWMLGIG